MNSSRRIDPDDVIRARTKLLASRGPTSREKVEAYRVLAQVNPALHLPHLVDALHALSRDHWRSDDHALRLVLCEEAVAAARAVEPSDPARERILFVALLVCHRELYAVGRRADGLAMRAELLAMERRQGTPIPGAVVSARCLWATGLSEEGRDAEAADALAEWVTAVLPRRTHFDRVAPQLVQWAATLVDAGRLDEALAAFGTLVDEQAEQAARERDRFCTLVRYADLLDRHGRGEQAAAVRQSARTVLAELAADAPVVRRIHPEPFWAVLLSLSAAGARPPGDGPHPPSGTAPGQWSPGAKQRHAARLAALREQVDALTGQAADDPDRHLAELVRLHRTLTVRTAAQHAHHVVGPQQLFDQGVELARRLFARDATAGRRPLAEALTDRSTYRAADGRNAAALDDFREALDLLTADH